MSAKEFEVRRGIGPRFTTDAFDEQVRAVQFHESIPAGSRERVQSVDVLGHDHQNPARFFQCNDRVMHGVWTCAPKTVPAFQLVIPMFDSRCF